MKIFEKTNVDGIMIGRAAIGNPWIFKQIQEHLQGKPISKISNEERLKIMLEHIELQVKELGENTGIKELRKYITYYLKNLKNASIVRQQINQIETKSELIACLTEYFKNL